MNAGVAVSHTAVQYLFHSECVELLQFVSRADEVHDVSELMEVRHGFVVVQQRRLCRRRLREVAHHRTHRDHARTCG